MHVCEVEGRVVLISAHQGEGNAMEPAKPSRAPDGEIDGLNDETFGDGAVVDDWEASHFAVVGGEDSTETLRHDEAILKAMPTTSATVNSNHTPRQQSSGEELDSSVASLSLKDLWPSSPKQVSKLESIWSSPEIPRPMDQARQAPPTGGGVPPGQKVISVEELERELTSSSPPHSSPLSPPQSHTSPLPQYSRSPPAHRMMYMAHPPPHGRLPVHPYMSRGWPPRGPLPPPAHLLPPHMLHHPPPHSRHQPPPGVHPFRHPLPHPPPHPNFPHPPRYPLLPPPPPHGHPHHQHPPPEHQQHQPPPPRRERSRRSELLSEMKGDGSGFMTQREKEWVVRIQLLQLQGTDPANEDYYYQNYVQRKARKESDESPSSALALPQVSREERKYRPMEFQQTLGKVPQSSITAPRKAIDVPSAGGGEGGGGKEATARKRQVLLIIEKLYGHVLGLEELERKALALSEGGRAAVLARKEAICVEIFTLLRLKTLDEETRRGEEQMFQQMTSYRKGKRLLRRILPVLTDPHAQAVLMALIRNINIIVKRDVTDQVLPELTPAIKGIITTCDLELITRCLSTLLGLYSGSAAGPSPVVKIAASEFGNSLLLNLVCRGKRLSDTIPHSSLQHQTWLTTSHQLHSTLSPHSQQLLSISSTSSLLTCLATLQ